MNISPPSGLDIREIVLSCESGVAGAGFGSARDVDFPVPVNANTVLMRPSERPCLAFVLCLRMRLGWALPHQLRSPNSPRQALALCSTEQGRETCMRGRNGASFLIRTLPAFRQPRTCPPDLYPSPSSSTVPLSPSLLLDTPQGLRSRLLSDTRQSYPRSGKSEHRVALTAHFVAVAGLLG